MTYNELLESLKSGKSTVISVGSEQRMILTNETKDGKETGYIVTKAVGGKVTRKIAETTLLGGLQSLAVRKGWFEFGGQAVEYIATFGQAELAQVEKLQGLQAEMISFGIEPRFVISIVTRFLKAINMQLVFTD